MSAGPAITLDKQAGTPSGSTVGSTIAYSFIVTNSGNVSLSSVVVDDPLVGTAICPATTLAPGASTTCTATYALTQADIDAGQVTNTASASGTSPGGATLSATDSTTTPVTRTSTITLDKHAGSITDVDGNGPDAGDTIAYSFVRDEHRQRDANPVGVTDPKVGTVTCPATSLAPGAVDDVHRDVHADPGRRERRARGQHRDGDRDATGRR